MWRLKHRLFGWHYVSMQFGWSHHVRRVLTDGNGEPYVVICGEHIPLRSPGYRTWHPLTFSTNQMTPDRSGKVTVLHGGKEG